MPSKRSADKGIAVRIRSGPAAVTGDSRPIRRKPGHCAGKPRGKVGEEEVDPEARRPGADRKEKGWLA